MSTRNFVTTKKRAEPKLRPDGSPKSHHLQLSRLTIDGLTGVFDLTRERFPGFANHLFVSADNAFGCAPEGVRLQVHIGRELAFALGRTIEPNRTVTIFVAGVIGALHPAEDLQRMKESVERLRAQGIEGID